MEKLMFTFYDRELYDNIILSKEEIERYIKYYLENIKILYKAGFQFKFLNSSEITPGINEENIMYMFNNHEKDGNDNWLYKNNIENFAKTLEKDGTYWLITVL